MAIITKRELHKLLSIHYVSEIILALAFVILKSIPWVATRTLGSSQFSIVSISESRCGTLLPILVQIVHQLVHSYGTHTYIYIQQTETQLLVFTISVIALRSRRRGHVNFLPYLSSACTMAKVGNFILFFTVSPMYGLTYSAIVLTQALLFPEPRFKGPDNVTYFMGDEFEKELAKDKKVNWLIEFYATWNPDCNEFASVFSELSTKYASKNLRFGKIDVSRSPKTAEKYGIVTSYTSRTLPTLILFKNGKEHIGRPLMNIKNRALPFSFTYENIESVFELSKQ